MKFCCLGILLVTVVATKVKHGVGLPAYHIAFHKIHINVFTVFDLPHPTMLGC